MTPPPYPATSPSAAVPNTSSFRSHANSAPVSTPTMAAA